MAKIQNQLTELEKELTEIRNILVRSGLIVVDKDAKQIKVKRVITHLCQCDHPQPKLCEGAIWCQLCQSPMPLKVLDISDPEERAEDE